MSTTRPEGPGPDALARLLRARAATGPLDIEVSGVSMGATIVGRSTVQVVAARRARWGQIWAYVDDDGTVAVHRLRGHRKGSLSFRGDGNGWRDPDVGPQRLVGRATAIVGPDGARRRVGLLLGPLLGARLLAARTVRRLVRRGPPSPGRTRSGPHP
jgi:hypothetical protein